MNELKEQKETPNELINTIISNPLTSFILDKLTLIVLIIFILFWNNKVNPKLKKIKSLIITKDNLEDKVKIKEILIRIAEITNADRVILKEFHNGEIYASGKHRVKISITSEYVAEGFKSIKHKIQSMPYELMGDQIDYLIENKEKYSHILDSELELDRKKSLEFTNISEKKEYLIEGSKIKHPDVLYGILTIQYVAKPSFCCFPTNDEYRINQIKKYIHILCSILEGSNKVEQNNTFLNFMFKK